MKNQIDLLHFLYYRLCFKWQKSFTLDELPCLPDMTLVGDFISLSGQIITIKSSEKLVNWFNSYKQSVKSDWTCGIGVSN